MQRIVVGLTAELADRPVTGFAISESPTYVARGVAALAADPDHPTYAGRGLSSHDLAVAYDVTDAERRRLPARLLAVRRRARDGGLAGRPGHRGLPLGDVSRR